MYNNYLNYIKKKKESLKYYIFDWDDNLLFMPTKIIIEELKDNNWIDKEISTIEFRDLLPELKKGVNFKIKNNQDSYKEFNDKGSRGNNAFLEDVKFAIYNNYFGPSWDSFIKCLIDASLFMILTARGHEPETIKKTVKWIIDNYLTKKQKRNLLKNILNFIKNFSPKKNINKFDSEFLINDYLDKCVYIGIQSKFFENKFHKGDSIDPSNSKKEAISFFIKYIQKINKLNIPIKIGFSDDTLDNINTVKSFFKEKRNLDIINYYLFDSSNQTNLKKVDIYENLSNDNKKIYSQKVYRGSESMKGSKFYDGATYWTDSLNDAENYLEYMYNNVGKIFIKNIKFENPLILNIDEKNNLMKKLHLIFDEKDIPDISNFPFNLNDKGRKKIIRYAKDNNYDGIIMNDTDFHNKKIINSWIEF